MVETKKEEMREWTDHMQTEVRLGLSTRIGDVFNGPSGEVFQVREELEGILDELKIK